MEPRKISIKLRRDPRETAERHSQANPLTLECTLASGEAVTETMELRAELHAAQTPATTPLAATAAVTMTTGDTGPWELEFTGAQMNQTVLPDASEDFWLVVYATDADDNLFTLGKIALTLTFDNVSQVTPPPPDPALFLDLGGTKWKVGEDYVVDDIVALDGSIYVCTADNTSAAGDEPGVGAEWESFWVLFSGGGGGSGDVTGPASSTDNAIARFNGTTGKDIQNSAATLNDNGGIAADTLAISTTPTGAGGTGIFRYDTGEKVPEVGIDGITLKIGVQEYVRVYNDTLATMAKGAVVYISGAQGNRVAVKLADASSESTSAGTLGIVAQSITAGAEGFVQVSGPMYNLNTSGLTAGALLFLSETAGEWTQTEPTPPAHGVRLAYVERVHASAGSIYIKVDNGYELGELHNVNDSVTGATAFLVKNSATNVWESKNASDSRTNLGLGTLATQNGTFSGTSSGTNTGDQTITLTGDVTGSGTGSFTATIAANAVTYTKMQAVSAASLLLGRGTAGTTAVREISLGTGLSMTGDVLSASSSGDVTGPASATDNAIARFNGTGGKTLQDSSIIVDDAQISPTPAVCVKVQQSGQTNSTFVLCPMGNGALIAGPSPDGTNTGGNARGTFAVDFQMVRTNPAHVASGASAVVMGGVANAATAANAYTIAGLANQATAAQAVAHGSRANSNRLNMMAHGNSSVVGECQAGRVIMRRTTTDATPVPLSMDGAAPSGATITTSTHFVLLNNQALSVGIRIIARSASGANHARFLREVVIHRDGNIASTTVDDVDIPRPDFKTAGASAWDVSITAEASSVGGLLITVTGAAATTIAWGARLDFMEIIRA